MAGFPKLTQALQSFARKQIIDARSYLEGAGKYDSSLADSLTYEVQGTEKFKPKVKFTMNYYGGFVDTGVRGTKNKTFQLNSPFANDLYKFKRQPAFNPSNKSIPPNVLDKWIVKKNLVGIRDKKGKFISRSSLKWLIAVSIHRKGLSASGFFSVPLQYNIDEFNSVFEDALAEDLINNLKPSKYFV